MKHARHLFLPALLVLLSGCSEKAADASAEPPPPTEAEIRAADEASLLATAGQAGVSKEEALAAKAEIDKVYDETSAKMEQAEAERIGRLKQLDDETCVANCDRE